MLRGLYLRTAVLLEAAGSFIWQENLGKIVITALLSMVPTFEGRYAVTVMLGAYHMPAVFAYLLAVICSTVPMPFILLLLRPVLDWLYTLPIKPVRKFAAWLERRSERKRRAMHENKGKGVRGKLQGRVSEEMIELIGLYIFVALPLPGTGCWTGSAIATLFEMPRGKAAIAILLGNATACGIMTLAALGVFSFL